MVAYPMETLDPESDDGTIVENVKSLAEHVVGHRIVSVEDDVSVLDAWGYAERVTIITLDSGKRVKLIATDDCCAYTELESFKIDPSKIQHAVAGIGTTDDYTTWHIFADAGDVMELKVGWSCGNPFYYGYGFTIVVEDVPS